MPKILLVEDDNNLREIFEMRLKAEGYNTVTAGNGEEALVVAMKEKPDLIIADVMMPKLSGFEMLETLRAAPEMASTKAIMMTALGQAEDRARGERLGVIKYLVKSQVTLEDFVRVVREVVAPDASAPTGTAAALPADPANSQLQNNQESEQSMQEDNTQSTPAPADSSTVPTTNPITDSGAAATPDQPTTAQEQSVVQDQINSFVASAPAGDTAATGGAGDAATAVPAAQDASEDPTAGAPTPGSSADVSGGPVVADNSGADTGSGPSIPVTSAPAEPASDNSGAGAPPQSNAV
jgi:CheY-like chemotaxis protein